MKARALQKRLQTERAVHETSGSINVASGLCPGLIKLNKETLKLSYALDAFNTGRQSINSDELVSIWDALAELCKTGEIQEYINDYDDLENPLPVFYESDGQIIEAVADEYGWPNTTSTGVLMYQNTFFASRKEAENYLRENLNSRIESLIVLQCLKSSFSQKMIKY